MANFCSNCGNPLEPTWEFCPYCQYNVYHKSSSEIYESLDNQSELYYTSNIEREKNKKERKKDARKKEERQKSTPEREKKNKQCSPAPLSVLEMS